MASKLFSPAAVGRLRLANRLCVPPMCQYMADEGEAGPWHLGHYGKLAGSGAGLVVLEAVAVSSEGRITDGCLGAYGDAQQRSLARVAAHCKALAPEVRLVAQLSHAGRKARASRPWEPWRADSGRPSLAPSAVAFSPEYKTPQAMTEAQIEDVIGAFAAAAARIAAAGFDGVQVHAAHGYLIHQFLSPLANRRGDRWGGSLENRMRFGLEVLRAVRASAPELALHLRVSATDWADGGWDCGQTVAFAREAAAIGCELVDVSSGGLCPQQRLPALCEGYQAGLARRVREEAGVPVAAVGLITHARFAEGLLEEGAADIVDVGRAVLR
ncbi:MAG: oxidoreductase, partial [Duodenibacillus sp.]|nr:oxidoreductase [Duodenibacillus sp.]